MDENKERVVSSILSQLKENKDGTANEKLINGEKSYQIDVKPFAPESFKGYTQVFVTCIEDNSVKDFRIPDVVFEDNLRRIFEEL